MILFVLPRIVAVGVRRGGLQVPVCFLCASSAILLLVTAMLLTWHAPLATLFVAVPLLYISTFLCAGLIQIGQTWCALTTGKNAVGVVGAVFRSVMQAVFALTPVASIALYAAAAPSTAAAEIMAPDANGGRAAIPFALLSGWWVICGGVCLATFRAGHPVCPPPSNDNGGPAASGDAVISRTSDL